MTKVVSEIFMALRAEDGSLRTREYYKRLEQAERAATCGVIGVGMAKCVAQGLLKVPALHLADPLIADGVLHYSHGRTRGDLVGWDLSGNWHVVEAKGRATIPSARAVIPSAKAQAMNLRLVSPTGTPLPAGTSSACVTALSHPVHVLLEDPPPQDNEDRVLTVDPNAYSRAYYRPAHALLEAEAELVRIEYVPLGADARFIATQLPRSDTWFGIHESLWRLVNEDPDAWHDEVAAFTNWWASVVSIDDPIRHAGTESDAGQLKAPLSTSVGLDGFILVHEPNLSRPSRSGVYALGFV